MTFAPTVLFSVPTGLAPLLRGWTRRLVAAAALGAACAAPVTAQAPLADLMQPGVTLRADPSVDGDLITLGDLFENAGRAADMAVARAPEPGQAVSLAPEWIARQAAEHGLVWADASTVLRVRVRRESQVLATAEIADLLTQDLEAREGGAWIVAISGARRLHAPVDVSLAPELVSVERDARSGRVTLEARLSPGLAPVRLTARAEPALEAVLLARPIARGDIISASDVTIARVPARRARAGALSSPDDLIGMQARRALRAGEPVVDADLARPDAVSKGDVVMVVFQTSGLTLTARARAQESAPLGVRARFTNLTTNRTIDAVVEGAGRARVLSPSHALSPTSSLTVGRAGAPS